jgi:phosphoserine phosphatase
LARRSGFAKAAVQTNNTVKTINTMKTMRIPAFAALRRGRQNCIAIALLAAMAFTSTIARAADPLPSWNDGPAKQSIIDFVTKVTTPGSPDFVPVPERIATFDNDGTLWCEKPLPVQLYFALDRVKALAPQHPEWKTQEPFASLLKGDMKTAAAGGDHALLELMMASHTGNTTEEFNAIVKDWIATATHPKTGKHYTQMVYQPMLEVLAYLRANGFKTFIVSGGGIEFMRAWAENVYGIPPEQVIGSSVKTKFELRDGVPVLVRLPQLNFNDDKAGKPVAINQHIGRRPVMAFGNSDGDLQMLQYTGAGSGARFCLYVHHDDAVREYAYDRKDALAKLDQGLDEAAAKGWTVVSMKNDWKQIFPFEVTAIDILLEPDATMLEHCKADNARLLGAYPQGFALDATHTPHITMLQCFVRTVDLDKVFAAEEKVLAAANVTAMKLEAFKRYYIPAGGGLGVAGICAKPTPEILKLQADIIAAASLFNLRSGPIGAFTAGHDNPAIDAAIIGYVSTFEQIGAGDHFNPHVSTGNGPTAYLDKMVAEPFEPFAFSPAGAAVYQLGPFGTAAKQLKEWDLKP